ncbi:hypothetical protein CPB85DRAFT_1427915 [Mucidula mucida]|nr:hypothetical protein CPB85DRAFT_1427915 [Mucidula mucida]
MSKLFMSLPKLTTLRLNDAMVAQQASFFRSLPQLRRLELINVYPDAQIVTSHPRGTNFPFPRLSSLAYVSEKKANFGTRDWLLSVARLGASPFTIELGGAAVKILDFTEEYEKEALRKRDIFIINAGILGGLLDENDCPDYEDNFSDDMSDLDDFEDYDVWEEDEEEEFDHEEDEYDYFFNG